MASSYPDKQYQQPVSNPAADGKRGSGGIPILSNVSPVRTKVDLNMTNLVVSSPVTPRRGAVEEDSATGNERLSPRAVNSLPTPYLPSQSPYQPRQQQLQTLPGISTFSGGSGDGGGGDGHPNYRLSLSPLQTQTQTRPSLISDELRRSSIPNHLYLQHPPPQPQPKHLFNPDLGGASILPPLAAHSQSPPLPHLSTFLHQQRQQQPTIQHQHHAPPQNDSGAVSMQSTTSQQLPHPQSPQTSIPPEQAQTQTQTHLQPPSPPPLHSQSRATPPNTTYQPKSPTQATASNGAQPAHQRHAAQSQTHAQSQNPQSHASPTPAPSNQIPPGGAPARRYLNENVTPALLDGMKMLAREQPKEPLLALAKFLEDRHRQIQNEEDVRMDDVDGE